MKRIIILVIISFPLFILAQTNTLKGVVKDNLGNPLSYVNIIAKSGNGNKKMIFGISDNEGRYHLDLKKDNVYVLTISMMGFESKEIKVLSTQNVTRNIILIESKHQLDEVIIELPVVVKKDTIIYDADKFVNGSERKLKNVLKKLPGIEVNRNGEVTINGKKVTKLLVDGSFFFGGSTKLGVENIPADAVDKVEVIDNYNEISFLKNVSDSEDMIMNIQLKEEKKRFVFGDVELGANAGYDSYHKVSANLFYYAPKTNINFIGNSNNIAEQTFTFKDYVNFQGGNNAVFSGDFNWKRSGFSQFLESSDILNSNQHFGALNISKTVASKLDISGYVIFSQNDIKSLNKTRNEYPTFIEDKTNNIKNNNLSGIGKLNLEYSPNTKERWYARMQVKKSAVAKNNIILSVINTDNNSIQAERKNEIWYVNQNIEWHKNHSFKHTFSAIVDYTFDKNTPNTSWIASDSYAKIIQNIVQSVDTTQSQLRLFQDKFTEKQYLYTVFKDFWVLNNNNHIYTTIGNAYEQEKFTTNDFQLLDDESKNGFITGGFNNNTVFKYNDFFTGLHYKFRTGIFTFKQGVFIHNYHWKVNQDELIEKNKWVLLPDFLLKIEFNKSKKIELNYNLKSNFADASQLANRFYFQSYNSVFKGNPTLENELYHSGRIRYSRFSLYRGLMLHANANYTKKVKGLRNAVNFDGVNRFLSIQLLENPNEDWNVRVSLRKRIKKIRYKLRGGYNSSKYLQSVNNAFVINKNTNYNFEIGAETMFDKFPTIEVGYKRTIGNYISSNLVAEFINNETFVNIDYDFFKSFIFNFDYRHYDNQNKLFRANNKYDIANATLSYQKEDRPWLFKLTTQNLFNSTFKQSNSFSDYLISDNKKYIMPRVVLFSIGYKL